MVTMCFAYRRLMWSTMDAIVEDLPEPVGPATMISPEGCSASSATTGGIPKLLSIGITSTTRRSTMAMEPRSTKHIRSEASDPRSTVAEVRLIRAHELFHAELRHEPQGHAFHIVLTQHGVADRHKHSVNTAVGEPALI